MLSQGYRGLSCCWRSESNHWGLYECRKCGAKLCYLHIVLWNNGEPRCYFCFSEVECISKPDDIIVASNLTSDNPKTALIVLDGLYLAGVQRHALDQIEVLKSYGYSTVIVTVKGAGGRWADKFLANSDKIILDVDDRLDWDYFVKIMHSKRIDIAVGHLSNPVRWINKHVPRNIPAYAHFHTDPSEFEIIKSSEFVEYCERFEKILFPSTVTLNHYTSLFLNGNLPKYGNKIKVFPNALPRRSARTHNYYRKTGEDLRIAVVSRLDPDKLSLALLIDTLLLLKTQGAHFMVSIAGGGELFWEIRDRISYYALWNNVKLLGFVDPVDEVYEWADVIFLPSIRESMPYVLLESISFEKPIVASRVGIFRDLALPANIYTFAPHDSREAARLILAISPYKSSFSNTHHLPHDFVDFESWSTKLASLYGI